MQACEIERIFDMKNFCIGMLIILAIYVGPALFIAAAGAFIQLDISLLNPGNWSEDARGGHVVWMFLVTGFLAFVALDQ